MGNASRQVAQGSQAFIALHLGLQSLYFCDVPENIQMA